MRNMLIVITDRGASDALMERLRKRGATGGTVLHGRGTAQKTFMSVLGLGETRKDILLSINGPETEKVLLEEAATFRSRGAVFSVHQDPDRTSTQKLLMIITEKGYADDVMATARKAGAGGGTVVTGHGTANENDRLFCGVHLVPEKEILLIVASNETAENISKRVGEMKCLMEKGMGIMFSVPVTDFRTLRT